MRGEDRCVLRSQPAASDAELLITQLRPDWFNFEIWLPTAIDDQGRNIPIVMYLGDYSQRLGLTHYGRRLEVIGFGEPFKNAFLNSEAMIVHLGDDIITTVDLSEGEAAFSEFDRCAQSLPPLPEIPAPTNSPPVQASG